MSSNKIVLISSDDETFEVDEAVARELQIIAHMMEDDCAGKPIPLQNVNGKDLSVVIEYCKKHVEAAAAVSAAGEEEEDAKRTNNKLKSWDTNFMKEHDLDTVFRLILAANYLSVNGLLDLATQTIADRIKDMTVEEVRDIFHIINDFTPEEEEAVRKENQWAFE